MMVGMQLIVLDEERMHWCYTDQESSHDKHLIQHRQQTHVHRVYVCVETSHTQSRSQLYGPGQSDRGIFLKGTVEKQRNLFEV